jgi:tripartite-type tricarboxylate transporter receptor subunit TctC
MKPVRSRSFLFGALLITSAALTQAAEDTFPEKPLKLVVPYAAGGVGDALGRTIALGLSQTLRQPVTVENRGGGGGTVGAQVVAKSPPDGYTILITFPTVVAIAPCVIGKLPYDAIEDFTPIGTFAMTPNILVVNSKLPIRTLADLGTYAKNKNNEALSYGSAGPGSTGHLFGSILGSAMGIEMLHVPYKSSALAFPDLISGRVSMVFDSVPSTIGQIRSGTVRPVAVMSDKRSQLLPDVPTSAEAGFPTARLDYWIGLEGPPKMDQTVVKRLNAAMRAAVALPEIAEQLSKAGAEPRLSSSEEFNSLRRQDSARLCSLVKELKIRN